MPFRPSAEIVEACDTIREEVERGQQAARAGEVREDHEQVAVMTPSGPAEVDRGLVPLLQCIWEFGVDTYMSCEDNMGSVWLCFELQQFTLLHGGIRTMPDLAYFVDSCRYDFSCQTPEHLAREQGDGDDQLPPALYLVNMRFPRRLLGTFHRLMFLAQRVGSAESLAERAERRAAGGRAARARARRDPAANAAEQPRDRSRSPRVSECDSDVDRCSDCHREIGDDSGSDADQCGCHRAHVTDEELARYGIEAPKSSGREFASDEARCSDCHMPMARSPSEVARQ
jgi:hypothetical protein